MTPEELNDRIRSGEDSTVEFKEQQAHPDDLAAAIVSFANAPGGGLLLLGVSDSGAISGVGDPDAAVRRISDICRNNIEEILIGVTAERVATPQGIVIAIRVPRGPRRPYRTNRGVYYVRDLAGRRAASPEEIRQIVFSGLGLYPDEMAVEDAGEEALDASEIRASLPGVDALREDERGRKLRGAKVMTDGGHPTLGGILCFGKDPQHYRPYARVTAIWHKGSSVTEEFLDREEIDGRLADQIRAAMNFVRRHAKLPASIYPFPYEMLDEAIVNAVAHRDYLAPAQVRLFIFDDRIEVRNPGRLLNTLTIEGIRMGHHLVRNPIVFSHLSRVRLATDAGRGVPVMFERARAAHLPDPEIVSAGSEFMVTFHLSTRS